MPDPNRIITQLELSVHTYWRLYKANLFTVARLLERAPEELLEVLESRSCLDELRRSLIAAGYGDPWPELDGLTELLPSPSIQGLGLRPDVEAALVRANYRTPARVLGAPADDLLDLLSWEQLDALRGRLLELGHLEPGNIESRK